MVMIKNSVDTGVGVIYNLNDGIKEIYSLKSGLNHALKW